MKLISFVLFLFLMDGCKRPERQPAVTTPATIPGRSYEQTKSDISAGKRKLADINPTLVMLDKKQQLEAITDFWVSKISEDLYSKWQGTPWDFNGTASRPKEGSIACGYFVTTMLRDMGLKINRSKLAVCASSEMMKSLVPNQKIRNMSSLSFAGFDAALKQAGKAVYIIGLDFHTGFIVNDGKDNWFIHSYYAKRIGVIKEAVLASNALRSSKTRWVISLTADKSFMYKWLKD